MDHGSARRYLLIGHVTKDRLPEAGYTIGGTVTYAGVAAQRLGWHPVVVTTCERGFAPPQGLVDFDWRILESPATTTFRNEEGPSGRAQVIDAVADPIRAEQVPADCLDAELVHLGPVAREIDASVVARLRGTFLTATLQGWLRTWTDQGVVSLGPWPEAEQILPQLRAAVLSIDDIRGDWRLAERWAALTSILVVTQDRLGCTVFHDGRKCSVPPRPAHVVEPTGCGDVFAAFFFVHLLETGDVLRSAYFANVAASMSVEHPGVQGIPARAAVEQYIRRNRHTVV